MVLGMDGELHLESLLPTLVVEPDPLVRRAVSALAGRALGGRVVSVVDALEAAPRLSAEVFGLVLFDSSNVVLLEMVTDLSPATITVLLASELRPAAVQTAVRNGVGAVISRHGDPGALMSRIRAAHAGGLYLDEHARAAMLAAEPELVTPTLSARELEVLGALESGQSMLSAARALGMQVSTAKSHAAKAAAKFGTSSSREAARMARELGMLKSPELTALVDRLPA